MSGWADIANYLYTHPKAVDLNLKGVWITDPSVSYDIVTEEIPALTFAEVCLFYDLLVYF
jgi:carboxypeptidase D